MLNRTPRHKQQGVILLLFLMVLMVLGTGVFLASANSGTRDFNEKQEIIYQMEQAKEALVAYAVNYTSFGDVDNTGYVNDQGPGHLPCPDTDNDAEPEASCNAYQHGRLPEYIIQPDSSQYRFNNAYADVDRQFWYVVSPAYSIDGSGALNTATTGSLTLDGEGDIVAVIIAPGIANASQDRLSNPTTASAYLEGLNASGSSFSNSYATDPDNFNDYVLPITGDELRAAMAIEVTDRLKYWHDWVYDTYFSSYLPAFYGPYLYNFSWLVNALSNSASTNMRFMDSSLDDWENNYTYTKVSTNVATIKYSNCGITFTMTYGGGITMDQYSC